MKYSKQAIAFCISLCAASIPAKAEETVDTREVFAQLDGWDVSRDRWSCVLARVDGLNSGKLFLVRLAVGTEIMWVNFPAGEASRLNTSNSEFRIGSKRFAGDPMREPGSILISDVTPELISALRKGKLLVVFADGKEVVKFPLKGSSDAYTSLLACAETLDPDALPPAFTLVENEPRPEIPEPDLAGPFEPNREASAINPGAWVWGAHDYPSRAIREGMQGSVTFRLTVSPTGMATGCEVTKSSGYEFLDQHTCATVSKHARLDPATDADGAPTEGTYWNTVRWSIPE